jgi:hypothetical protein
MKLTKTQQQQLYYILHHIERANKYLLDDKVVGIAHKTDSPNGASYTINNTDCSTIHHVDVMDKHIGSDITGVYDTLKLLKRFIEETLDIMA